jgi:diaminohydroxyphosphoribosylaminopyrimidine deaminase/5-amino-6-(5-phosphoribosylamino)uracil reductase
MRRAIGLAAARVGLTGANPSVGCVVAMGGEIVSEAATAEGGRPHAEEQALAAAGDRARGAIVYLTLEPCGERRSGAPSCSELLADAGVARVVVACRDASPFAAGRGLRRLAAAGVPVERGLLQAEAEALYTAYKP